MAKKTEVVPEQNTPQSAQPISDLPMKPMSKNSPLFTKNLLIVLIIVILLGVGSGYLLSSKSTSGGNALQTGTVVNPKSLGKGAIVGSKDTKTFKDTAEGILKAGGTDGEGQFHLVRPGGDSQNVYLTSSNVDLSLMIGKKIKVWGQTQKAQTAGWLMDVGRVEIE